MNAVGVLAVLVAVVERSRSIQVWLPARAGRPVAVQLLKPPCEFTVTVPANCPP